MICDVTVVDSKQLKGGVMRVRLTDGHHFASAVVFAAAALADDLREGARVSVVGQLQCDDYRGGDAVQFVIEDVVLDMG
jgi:single-stranded-DNA-specific exonuclease